MNFANYLWHHHKLKPSDVELTDRPGTWRVKAGCPGGDDCRHTARIAGITCNGGTPLNVSYAEWGARDERGRYVSPYREWYRQRNENDPDTSGGAFWRGRETETDGGG